MTSLSRDSQGRSMLSLIDWQHDHIDTGLSRVPANCHCAHGLRITPWSCFLARGWKNSSPTIITRETSRGERDFYLYILNLNHAAFGSDQKGKSSGQFFPMRKKREMRQIFHTLIPVSGVPFPGKREKKTLCAVNFSEIISF